MKLSANTLIFISAALLASTAASAATDTSPMLQQPRMINSGFSLGVTGGGSVGISPLKGNYEFTNGTDTTFNTIFDNSVANITGSLGILANYSWAVTNRYALGIEADFLYNFGTLDESWVVPDVNTPEGKVLNLDNRIRFKEQYNIQMLETYALNNSFDLLFNAGFSSLNVENKVTPSYADGTQTSGSFTDSKYLFGGIVGAGLKYTLTRHSSLAFRANVAIYAPRSFKEKTAITPNPPAGSDKLKPTKISVILPTISLTYSYKF